MILSRPRGGVGLKRQDQFFLLHSARPQGGRRGPQLKYKPETSQPKGGAPMDRPCSFEGQRRHECPLSKTQQGERSRAMGSSGMTSRSLRSKGIWEWEKGPVSADGQNILRGQRCMCVGGQRSRGIHGWGSQRLAVTADLEDSVPSRECGGRETLGWHGGLRTISFPQSATSPLHRIALLLSAPQDSDLCSRAPRRWPPVQGQPATTYGSCHESSSHPVLAISMHPLFPNLQQFFFFKYVGEK